MSDIVRVSPEEARALIEQGYVYVDVRSEQEFAEGHVPGAFNVPLNQRTSTGIIENPEFLPIMQKVYAKDAPLLLGCRTGNRSLKAAQKLLQAGYTNLRELRTGWDGSRDAFGRPEPGWVKKGFPVETGAPPGRRYEDMKNR